MPQTSNGEDRPTPEQMLLRAAEEEARAKRGKLKVFFGAAPGVGKTYAMLEAGLRKKREGTDVVIGWVETHKRAETDALARQLERLPPRLVSHRNVELAEFDLDGALQRRPGLLLLDELPHTNAPGSRHNKRWQDLVELLEADLDVYTTLNVQHLESVNDVVAQITGVVVKETVPDAIFDKADEIELVDISPEDLLERLSEGKVYLGAAAARAADNFFREGNLIALRELALRRSTERVDAQVEAYRREHGISEPWNTGERLLVAAGPAPSARDLVRATYRMASRLRAPWLAVSVENTTTDSLPQADRERTRATLALAEQLGATVEILRGESVADEIIRVCRARNVSRIVLGRPTHSRWRDRLRGSLVDALIRQADGIDVLVTKGEPEGGGTRPSAGVPWTSPWREWLEALGWVGAATVFGLLLERWLGDADRAMVYLLAVLLAATRVGAGPSLLAAVVSVAAFDFLFVLPKYTFAVNDQRYLLTFAVMLVVGVLVSRLTLRIRRQAEASTQRERRTAALYALSRELARERDPATIAKLAVEHVQEHLQCPAIVWIQDELGLLPIAGQTQPLASTEREIAVGRWVLEHGRPAGAGTETLPSAVALHLPLSGTTRTIGVLAILLSERPSPLSLDHKLLCETFAHQTALALERALLAEEAEKVRIIAETERLRNELLSAVSHDLRTPLASITGSATAMLGNPELDPAARHELLDTIREEGEHLGRLVADLLDLTRIESGTVRANLQWVPVEEVIDAALARTEPMLKGFEVEVDVPEEVLTAPMDPTLMVQVLVNLLENAAKHAASMGTAESSEITVLARTESGMLHIEVCDRGPGVPPGEEERIFEKFYRTADGQRVPGTGLGLAICRAVVHAHGGTVRATTRWGGGARFVIELPMVGDQPQDKLS
jgi:two-component system sensor histidine kinase KdpD